MRLETKVNAFFALGLLIIICVGVRSVIGVQQTAEINRIVIHTHEVLEKLEQVLSLLKDAETGQRGFILTGEERYLEPFDKVEGTIWKETDSLLSLTKDNPDQQRSTKHLVLLSRDKLSELRETITHLKAGRKQAALQVIRSDRGKQIMDMIRAEVSRMESREWQLLDKRNLAASKISRQSAWAVGGSFLLSLLVLSVIAVIITRTVRFTLTPEGSGYPRATLSGILIRYSFACAMVEMAMLARQWLTINYGPLPAFIMFYPAILLVATTAGGGPGIMATLLSVMAADYWYFPPYGTFAIDSPNDAIALGIFGGASLCLSILAERSHRARWAEAVSVTLRGSNEKLRKANDDLQAQSEELKNQHKELQRRNEELAQLWEKSRLSDEALAASEERFRNMFERHKAVMLLVNANNGAIVDANAAAAEFYGRSSEDLRQMNLQSINLLPAQETVGLMGEVRHGQRNHFIAQHRLASGDTRWVEVYSTPIVARGKEQLFSIIHDISGRKLAEEEREASAEFLRIANESQSTRDLTRMAATFFQQRSGCEAVGIRLRDGDDYPYSEVRGFSQDFVLAENSLCSRDPGGDIIRDITGNPALDCMCGNVLCRRFDPANPFFTTSGSFWTNSTSELLASTSEADRQSRTRNRCNGEGFESVALIPLRLGVDCLGLLQLNDRQRGRFSPAAIALWERLADYLAVALAKFRADEALKQSEEEFRTLANSIPQLGWMAKADGWISWFNRRWYDYTGTTPDQVEGWGWQSVHDPEVLPDVLQRWRGSIATGRPFDMVFPLLGADGALRPFLTRVQPVYDAEGKVVRWFGTSTDISEQQKNEQALREVNQRLSLLAEASGSLLASESPEDAVDALCLKLLQLLDCHVYLNFLADEVTDRLQLNACYGIQEELKARTEWLEYDAALCSSDLLETGQILVANVQETADPRAGHLKSSGLGAYACHPLTVQGRVLGTLSFGSRTKVTFTDEELSLMRAVADLVAIAIDRKRAEEELRSTHGDLERRVLERTEELKKSEQEFRYLAEAVPQMVWATRPDGWNIYFNQHWVDYTGLTMEESYGHGWNTPFHPDDKQQAWEAWQRATGQGERYSLECRLRRADGVYRWWLIRGEPMRGANGEIVKWFGTCTDIEELKRSEAVLHQANDLLELRVDARTKALRTSEERHRLLSETMLQGVVHQDTTGAIIRMNPSAERILGKTCEQFLGSNSVKEEHDSIRENGEPFPGAEHPSMVALRTGQTVRGVVMGVFNPQLGEYRWLSIDAVPVYLPGEQPSAEVYTVFEDLTDRKRAQEALAAAKDQLAGDLDAMTRLQTLGTVFVRQGDMRTVLDTIVETAIAITNADMGNIQLLDKQSGRLKIIAQRGFEQSFLDFWNSVAEGQGACGTALHHAERMIIEDVTQSSIFVGKPALEVQLAAGVRAVQSTPLLSRSGKPLGVFSTHFRNPHRPDERSLRMLDLLARQAADIIERSQTEEALRESEEQFRALADSIPNLAWRANGDGHITWYNQRWYEYTGMTPELMEGWGWQSVHEPSELPKVLKSWEVSIASGEPFEMTFPLRGADGVFRPFLTRIIPLKNADGRVLQWFGTNTDVSELKRIEQALRESEERFRVAQELSPDGFTILRPVLDALGRIEDFTWIYENATIARLTGTDQNAVVGRRLLELLPGHAQSPFHEAYIQVAETGEPCVLEASYHGDSIRTFTWFRVAVVPIGRDIAILAQDLTTSKQAEEALRESERRLLGVLESMPDAFVSFDSGLRYTYLNRNAERMQAASRDELLGKDVRAVYPDPESSKTIALYEQVIAEGMPVTSTSYHAGFDRWVEVCAFPTPDGLSVFYKDVSDMVKAELALHESEERLRRLGDNLPDSAVYQYVHEPEGRYRFVYFSAGVEELNCVTVAEVLRDPDSLHRQFLPEYRERLMENEALSRRELSDFDMEIPMRRPDGMVRWMRLHSRPRRLSDGSTIWDGVQTDITERKGIEDALKASLREKEILLKEIHHRVKNNLQVISSLVSLQADGSKDEAARQVLQDVTYRVRSMALVHEKLYQSADLARIDFAEYARSLLSYLWRAHGAIAAAVRMTLDLEPVSLPADLAVPCGLILNELAVNALEHAFQGRANGEVTVSLHSGSDERIRLSVADNGVGLPEGFDWRQTRSLGLRLVQMLARQLEATVEVSGGVGAKFEIVFGCPVSFPS